MLTGPISGEFTEAMVEDKSVPAPLQGGSHHLLLLRPYPHFLLLRRTARAHCFNNQGLVLKSGPLLLVKREMGQSATPHFAYECYPNIILAN